MYTRPKPMCEQTGGIPNTKCVPFDRFRYIWCATFTGQPFFCFFVWWPHSARSHRLPISMILLFREPRSMQIRTLPRIVAVTGTRHLYAKRFRSIVDVEKFLVSNGPRWTDFTIVPSTHNRRSFMMSITLFIYQHSTQYMFVSLNKRHNAANQFTIL